MKTGITVSMLLLILMTSVKGFAQPCAVTGTGTTTPACIGSSNGTATITLSGAGSGAPGTYTVDGGPAQAFSSNPFIITGLAAGSYTIIATVTAGSCVSDNISISVSSSTLPIPVVAASATPPSICVGSSSTLNGSGASTYTWQPGSLTGASVSVSPAITTTYTVTGANADGCSPATNWLKISSGGNHSLGIKTDGTLWAWGSNDNGQVGDGTLTDRHFPVQIGTANDWAFVAGGSFHSLAIKNNGTLWAWGDNATGQLGDGTTVDKSTPVQVGLATNWSFISAGLGHTIGLRTDGTLWGWGANNHTQVGDGTIIQKNSPVQLGVATNWSRISVGSDHNLATKSDGTLWAWGRNTNGQLGDGTVTSKSTPTQIGVATNWSKIGASFSHSLAIKLDGTLWTWGQNNFGQLGDGTAVQKTSPIQIGAATDWTEVDGGLFYSLAQKSNGTLWSWGYNIYGMLGDGTTVVKNTPIQSGTATNWTLYSCGLYHVIGLRTGGTMWSWGWHMMGRLGDGSVTNKLTATQVISQPVSVIVTVNPLPVVSFSGLASSYCLIAPAVTLTGSPAGGTFSGPGISGNTFNPGTAGAGTHNITYTYTNGLGCTNTSTQTVTVSFTNVLDWVNLQYPGTASFCQGNNLAVYGQIYEPGLTEAPGAGAGVTVEMGYSTVNSNPATWINWQPATFNVQVGNNDEYFSTLTNLPAGTYYYTFRYAYTLNVCGYQYGGYSSGGGAPWDGVNYVSGVLTVNTPPTIVVTSPPVVNMCAGAGTTLTATGAASYLWMPGSLTGPSVSVNPAVNTTYTVSGTSAAGCAGAVTWIALSAGGYHNIGIKSNGTLWSFGSNLYGQVGDGTNADKLIPVQIGSGTNWVTVSAGSFHSLAIKSDGTLWAWGQNFRGQLGDGTTVDKNSPVQIGSATNWAAISAGGEHSMAIKTDGTLWAWGYNGYGQLGDGTFNQRTTPVQIGTATNWATVSSGGAHTLAIKTDGTLWSWGRNTSGQLGNGTVNMSNTNPVQVGSANNWKKIAAAFFHSLAIKTNGTLWTWGRNMNGQMGDGTVVDKSSPVQIGVATDWASIDGGIDHSIATKTGGTLWGCGMNNSGHVGDGTLIQRTVFVQSGVLTDWLSVDAGTYHSTATKKDGSLHTYGRNMEGQLGDGNILVGNKPNPTLMGTSVVSVTVNVNPLPSVSFSGLAANYCSNSAAVTLTGSPAGGTFSGPGVSGNLFDPSAAGGAGVKTITYTYTDLNGCTNSSSQNTTIFTIPGGSVSFSGLAATYCTTDAPATLTGSPAGGTFSGPGISGNIFSPAGAGVGTHNITYTYSDGICSSAATSSVTVLPDYIITATAGTGGSISPLGATTVCSGGGQVYTIIANVGYNIADVLVDGISVGAVSTYAFTNVTAARTIHAVFIVTCNVPSLSANITDVLCNGGNNGAIDLVLTGGSSPFTFAWTGSGGFTASAEDISSLAAGVYNVTVTATGGCTTTGSYTVNQPAALAISCSGTNVTCNGASNGTALVSVNGGTGPYTYSWTDGTSTNGSVNINPSKDNTIYSTGTTNSNALGENLAVGKSNTGNTHRALMAFDIFTNIPAGSIINSATLTLNVSASAPGAGVQPIYVHKLTADWGEGTSFTSTTGIGAPATTNDATWLHGFFPSTNWTNTGGDFIVLPSAVTNVNTLGSYSWSSPGMVSDIQSWLNSPAGNYGWIIKGAETANSQSKRLDSRENSTTSNWPQLAVNYSTPNILGTSNSLSGLPPGTYTVTVTDANGCSSTCSYTVTEPPPLLVSFSGLSATYCTTDAPATLTGSPAGGTFSGPGITGNSFDPSAAGAGTHTVTYTFTDGNNCTGSSSQNVTVSVCGPTFATLNLTAFLEGFHYDINTMRANIFDLGISTISTETDTLLVGLWAPANLTNPSPDYSMQTVISTNGTCSPMQFPAALIGNSYYIQVKHRNHIETWSAAPVAFTATTSYDFTTSQAQAYDDGVDANPPMAPVAGSKFAFYAGDVNQDGGVDGGDASALEIDVNAFAFGYNASDANGDGSSDGLDASLIEVNANLFIFYSRP